MNRIQYLLSKLAEEASELSQIALKTQQFGIFEECPGLSLNNCQRIEEEFNDVLGIIALINMHLDGEFIAPVESQIVNKANKVEKYYQYSIECGQVKE